MPSVSLDTHFYTVSLEKFGESVNRRRIDNAIKEQTMIYKTLHRKLKIEQHELLKTVGLRCSRKVSSSYCIAACEILRFPSEIYRQYTYIVDKYIIYFYELQKQEKSEVRRAFVAVSQRFQINVIFTDHVHILCLSCKVKKFKTTANLPENIRNKRHSKRLPWCRLSRLPLYWYSFFSLLNMNQVPEKLYFGEWSYTTKIIQSVQYACLIRSSAG